MSPWNLFRRRKVNAPIPLDDFTNKYTQAENTTDKDAVEEDAVEEDPVKTFQDKITKIEVPTIIKEKKEEPDPNHTQFKNLCNELYDILQRYLRDVDKFYVDADQEKDLTHKLLIQLLTPLNQLGEWYSIPPRTTYEYKNYSLYMKRASICLSQLSSQPQSSILYYNHIEKFQKISDYFESFASTFKIIDLDPLDLDERIETFRTNYMTEQQKALVKLYNTKNSSKKNHTAKKLKTLAVKIFGNQKLQAFNKSIKTVAIPKFNTDPVSKDLNTISSDFYNEIKYYFYELNHPYHDIMDPSITPDKIPQQLKSAADYLIKCASYLQQIENSDNNYKQLLCPIKNLKSTLSTMAKGRSNIFSNRI